MSKAVNDPASLPVALSLPPVPAALPSAVRHRAAGDAAPPATTTPEPRGHDTAAAVLDLVARLLSARDAAEARQMAARWTADYLAAQFVVIGAASPGTLPCRIAAVAGPAAPSQERDTEVEAALGEAVVTTRWHSVAANGANASDSAAAARVSAERDTIASLAHRQLARVLGHRLNVIGLPLLTADDRPVGAMLVATLPHDDGPQAHSRRMDFLQQLAAPLAETLTTLERAAPGRLTDAYERLSGYVRGRRGRLLLLAALLLTVVAMIPVRYPVRAEVTLQARLRRSISAPLAAVLKQVHVTPGQSVRAGDLLLTLDEAETVTRLAAIEAEANRAVSARIGHLAGSRLAEAELARLQAARLAGEIDLLRQQLRRAEVRSPIDGIVLSEELEPLVGAPLEVGQLLMEIAPPEQFTARLRIPPDQICHVQPEQPVAIRLASAGSLPATSILRVHPRAQPDEQGVYVFTATAAVPDPQRRLKPGMQGVATIYGDRQALIWCSVQRIWQRVRTWI